MNESTSISKQEHEPGTHPDWPAPIKTTGAIAWMRDNLFSSPLNTILTVLAAYFLYTIIPPIVDWMFVEAVWSAENRSGATSSRARGHAASRATAIGLTLATAFRLIESQSFRGRPLADPTAHVF